MRVLLLSVILLQIGCSESDPTVVFLSDPPSDDIFTAEKIRDTNYVKLRLDSGLHPDALNAQTTNQDHLLIFAVRHRARQTVEVLLDAGAEVNIRSKGLKKTPLFQAAFQGDLEIVKLLVDRGATVNAVDDSGNNALREAILGKHGDVVEYLINAGCDLNQRNSDRKSMRDLAIQHGTEEIKKLVRD